MENQDSLLIREKNIAPFFKFKQLPIKFNKDYFKDISVLSKKSALANKIRIKSNKEEKKIIEVVLLMD